MLTGRRHLAIPTVAHDVALDLLVTPGRTHTCRRGTRHEPAAVWDELTTEKIESIPLLASRSRMRMAR